MLFRLVICLRETAQVVDFISREAGRMIHLGNWSGLGDWLSCDQAVVGSQGRSSVSMTSAWEACCLCLAVVER